MNIDDRDKKKEHADFKEVIEECLEKSKNGNFLFRGTNQEHVQNSNMIESSLYRSLKNPKFIDPELDIFNIESKIVTKAEYLFPPNTKAIEILTELRHYGEKLCIIDFTTNLFIALFFACQKTFGAENQITQEHGEFILLEMPERKSDIDYQSKTPYVIKPTIENASGARVSAQSSIFIHAPNGFIDCTDPNIKLDTVRVEYKTKQKISNYLKENHNIDAKSMFNDVIGFINNEKNIDMSSYGLGLYACRKGQYQEAVNHFNDEIKIHPLSYRAISNRAAALLELDQFDKSIEDCSRAIKIDPRNEIGYYNRGNAKNKKGDYTGALLDFNVVINFNPKNKDAHMLRAVIFNRLKKYDESINELNKALSIDPNFENAIQFRDLNYLLLDKHEEINTDRDSPESTRDQRIQKHIINGLKYSSRKMYTQSIEEFDQAIKLDPKNVRAYTSRGEAKYKLQNFVEAMNDFDTIINLLISSGNESSPYFSLAYQFRGFMKVKSSDFLGAIENFNLALKANPHNPETLHYRASAFYSLEKDHDALIDVNRAIGLKPDFIEALHTRKAIHDALGNTKEAENDLEEIERLSSKVLQDSNSPNKDSMAQAEVDSD